jgi:hypothetical protein
VADEFQVFDESRTVQARLAGWTARKERSRTGRASAKNSRPLKPPRNGPPELGREK